VWTAVAKALLVGVGQPGKVFTRVALAKLRPAINGNDAVVFEKKARKMHLTVNHSGVKLPQSVASQAVSHRRNSDWGMRPVAAEASTTPAHSRSESNADWWGRSKS